MFFKKDYYEKLGGFDEDYFMYMEDEDICLRSWKSGKPVIYFPEATMIHHHLRGSAKLGKMTFLHFKSLFIFFKKHGFSIASPVEKGIIICQPT